MSAPLKEFFDWLEKGRPAVRIFKGKETLGVIRLGMQKAADPTPRAIKWIDQGTRSSREFIFYTLPGMVMSLAPKENVLAADAAKASERMAATSATLFDRLRERLASASETSVLTSDLTVS